MKAVLITVLLIIVSLVWGQIEYHPITGALLEHWNTAYSTFLPQVNYFDSSKLPEDIYELRIVGIEVESL